MKENNSNKTNDPLQLIFDSYPTFKFIENKNDKMYEGDSFDNWWSTFEYSESSKDFVTSIRATASRIIAQLEIYSHKTEIDVSKNIDNLKLTKNLVKEEYDNIRFDKTPLKSREDAEIFIDKLGKILGQLNLLENTLLLSRYNTAISSKE